MNPCVLGSPVFNEWCALPKDTDLTPLWVPHSHCDPAFPNSRLSSYFCMFPDHHTCKVFLSLGLLFMCLKCMPPRAQWEEVHLLPYAPKPCLSWSSRPRVELLLRCSDGAELFASYLQKGLALVFFESHALLLVPSEEPVVGKERT